MRRLVVAAVLTLVTLVALAPPGFAQAPSPKVTLSGLFDQITSMGRNTYDGNLTRNSDSEWYARTRFRPDFEFAVGRVKAVLGIEIDLAYGQMGPNDGGFPGNSANTSGCKVNTNGCLDLNTDVGGMLEVKWIYTEFPLTGKDSLLPFIPVETMARAGGQPFDSLATYKGNVYATGDFAGIAAITRYSPQVKSNLAWVILEDQVAGANRGTSLTKTGRGEDSTLIASVDVSPTKGLDLKPLYSWIHADGQTAGSARRNLANIMTVGGLTNGAAARSFTSNAAGDPTFHENRHTVGVDARWRIAGFGLDPTFYYQFGHSNTVAFVSGTGVTNRASATAIKEERADISAFLLDVIASYQLGPLLLEGRGAWSSGNKARDNLAKSINYYQPLDTDGSYFAANWTQFWASGIDYFNQGWATTGNYVGYDRYGRISAALRATYSITPALSVYSLLHAFWTAQAVDTDTGSQLASAGGVGTPARVIRNTDSAQGDSNYVGTEINLGTTWRFSANTAFDLVGGYLFAGDALDASECIGVANGATTTCNKNLLRKKSAQDAYTLAARVRLAF